MISKGKNPQRRGLIGLDEMELGIRIQPDHTVIDCENRLSPHLMAFGPFLRVTYCETIAVPELRAQARRAAETIFQLVASSTPRPVTMKYMSGDVNRRRNEIFLLFVFFAGLCWSFLGKANPLFSSVASNGTRNNQWNADFCSSHFQSLVAPCSTLPHAQS